MRYISLKENNNGFRRPLVYSGSAILSIVLGLMFVDQDAVPTASIRKRQFIILLSFLIVGLTMFLIGQAYEAHRILDLIDAITKH